jgi:hypothetical protein
MVHPDGSAVSRASSRTEEPFDPTEEVTELERTPETLREASESLQATASTLWLGTSRRALRQALTVVEGQLGSQDGVATFAGRRTPPEVTRVIALSGFVLVGYGGVVAAFWLSGFGRTAGPELPGALIPLIVVSQATFLLLVGFGLWGFFHRRGGARGVIDERWASVARRSRQDVAGTLGDRPDQDEVVAALVALRLVEPDERRLSSRLRRDGSRFLYRAVWEVLQLDRQRLLPFSTVVALARVLSAQGTQMTRIVSAVSVVVLGVHRSGDVQLDPPG